jgi:hypothetical protein
VSRTQSLVEEIERDALDSATSLADALRKCIALGGHSGSTDLREWAARELNGYERPSEVPDYRAIVAPIVIDGMSGNNQFTRMQVSVMDLPEMVREGVSEEIRLQPGVGELEHLVREERESGEAIRVSLPGGVEIARLMTYERGERSWSVERVYWNISPTAIVGALGHIRTQLVELAAEIRAEAESDPAHPSAEAVQNAVNVVIHDSKRTRVHVNAAQATDHGRSGVRPEEQEPPWWKTTRVLWAFVVGAAGIVAAIFAWLQWAG